MVRDLEQSQWESAEDKLAEMLDTWTLMESRSHEWGTLYDIMHRTGENE